MHDIIRKSSVFRIKYWCVQGAHLVEHTPHVQKAESFLQLPRLDSTTDPLLHVVLSLSSPFLDQR